MKTSFGRRLPESESDLMEIACSGEPLRYKRCLCCKQDFTSANTQTPAGWAGTQISGYCEACFDKLFEE